MPVRVLDLEWTEALPLDLVHEPGGIIALVRVYGRPAGMARLQPPNGLLPEALIRDLIASQIDLRVETFLPPSRPVGPVSIVVCTRDRPTHLNSCLEALRTQIAQGHEVIVVDNAPTTNQTARLVQGYPYRYLVEPHPGLNRARNCGLGVARHEIIAFTDDDCVPDPGWAKALAAALEPETTGAATGLVMPLELVTQPQENFEAYSANRRIFRPRLFRTLEIKPSTAGASGMGANMAFRRSLLEQAGGFDTRLDGGTATLSGGDTDMLASVLDLGFDIQYTPDALVWHRHPRDRAALRRVIYGYGAGLFAFLSKRLFEQGDLSVLLTGPRWLAGPPVKALARRLSGRPAAPFELVLWEAFGALSGPWRYLISRRGKNSVVSARKSARG